MTRRDYVLLADAMRTSKPAEAHPVSSKLAWLAAVVTLAHKLAQNNRLFNTDRFLTACDAVDMEVSL